jgi:hypothetical protein
MFSLLNEIIVFIRLSGLQLLTLSKFVTPQTAGASSNAYVATKFTLIELITPNYEPIASVKIIPPIGSASWELKSHHGERSRTASPPTFVHSCCHNLNQLSYS